MRSLIATILLALPTLPLPAFAGPACPQAELVHLPGQGEAIVEGVQGGLCLLRLADGRQISAAPADLIPVAAGDTPPAPSLPQGLFRCQSPGAGRAPFGLAIAPGLYILDDGSAGSLSQTGADISFDSGPLQGAPARIESSGPVPQLALTPPGARVEARCLPWHAE